MAGGEGGRRAALRSKPERGREEKERGGNDSGREGMGGGRGERNGARARAGDGHAGRARRVERIPRRTGAQRGALTMGVSAPAGDGASGRIPWAC